MNKLRAIYNILLDRPVMYNIDMNLGDGWTLFSEHYAIKTHFINDENPKMFTANCDFQGDGSITGFLVDKGSEFEKQAEKIMDGKS